MHVSIIKHVTERGCDWWAHWQCVCMVVPQLLFRVHLRLLLHCKDKHATTYDSYVLPPQYASVYQWLGIPSRELLL